MTAGRIPINFSTTGLTFALCIIITPHLCSTSGAAAALTIHQPPINSSSSGASWLDSVNVHHPQQFYYAGDLLLPLSDAAGAGEWRNDTSKLRRRGLRGSAGAVAAPCGTGNPIDDCWQCNGGGRGWAWNRKKLADCAVGFGRAAMGGRNGRFYTVTDPSDHDPVHPAHGTLRHAVIQSEPLWIVFAFDMTIVLRQELLVNSYKTIDGRGRDVHVAYGACITLQSVSHVIIHGIHVHDCKPAGNAVVRDSPSHAGWRTVSDGDGISLFGATDVWVDHVSFSRCTDGLLDAVMGSTRITVSNCYFTHHDKVMLLGHSDDYVADKAMKVTIAFNHFGEGLVQRMPRCRHGFFEIVNNDYTHWQMYAIGGSAAPTIDSKGNRFTATKNPFTKDVTMRMNAGKSKWQQWNWHSQGDLFLNGAYFTPSGAGVFTNNYRRPSMVGPRSSSMVPIMTANAGALPIRCTHPPHSCT